MTLRIFYFFIFYYYYIIIKYIGLGRADHLVRAQQGWVGQTMAQQTCSPIFFMGWVSRAI